MKRQEGYVRRREGHMAARRIKVAMVAAVTGTAMAAATAFAASSSTAHGKTALASAAQAAQAPSNSDPAEMTSEESSVPLRVMWQSAVNVIPGH